MRCTGPLASNNQNARRRVERQTFEDHPRDYQRGFYMGRPRLYEDHASFDAKVDEYFGHVEAVGKRPTLAGLSYYLGFDDREGVTQYAEYGADFSRTVKRAKLRIEDDRWQSLIDKAAFTPGLIFDLKNNHGWKDKTEQDINLSGHEEALGALK